MAVSEGTASAVSTDPHLNASIDDVLSSFGLHDDAPTGAEAEPSQTAATPVETSSPAAPTPGEPGAPQSTEPLASGSSPDPTAPPADPEPQYEPFTFQVNGESRTMEGTYRIPGEGVYITEPHVARWQQLASRAEANELQLRALHQDTESWNRLTQWTVPGPNGQPQTISGQRAYEIQRMGLDGSSAAMSAYRDLFSDPQKLASLLVVDPQTGKIAFDPLAKENFDLKLNGAVREAIGKTQAWLAQQGGGRSPAPAPSQPDVPIGKQIEGKEPAIVTSKLQEWGVKGLTQQDVTELASHLPRYIRLATKEDVATDPGLRLGQPVLENAFEQLVRQYANGRASGASSAQAKAAADKFNAGQNKGRAAPPQPKPAQPVSQEQPESRRRGRRHEPKGPSWDAILERGLNDPDVQAALNGA